ncbi:MAG: NYN domain-containing protein [Lentisphaeria bacterium]|nr:NYN domain-containing protein [Lentisphaeria bacterium]
MDLNSRLMRIGIFYDGNYFYHVSNYYCYAHPRRARLSIPGIHEFIKKMVSEKEHVDERLCQIVDCHYFRGRLPAMEANARRILLNERIFDDILMREGVVTHYLPMSHGMEKGVDVSLALETLELAIFKQFNILVLIASDGDYVPLVRKLNSLGTRVMVLAWNFEYMDDNGNLRYTGTSQKLLSEVSYPLIMDQIIDGKIRIDRINVDSLFVPSQQNQNSRWNGGEGEDPGTDDLPDEDFSHPESGDIPSEAEDMPVGEGIPDADRPLPEGGSADAPSAAAMMRGRIVQLKNGYGFISSEGLQKNLFFFWEDLENIDFNDLRIGDEVEYEPGRNDRGDCARRIHRV